MLNLYSLEQTILDRQTEMTKQYRRQSLLRDAAGAQPEWVNRPALGSSARSRVGLMLVRVGARLAGAAISQRPTGTHECVCVPVS